MEVLVILLFVVLVLLILSFRGVVLRKIGLLDEELVRLREEIARSGTKPVSQPPPGPAVSSSPSPATPSAPQPSASRPPATPPSSASSPSAPKETEPFTPAYRPQPSYQPTPAPASATPSSGAVITTPSKKPPAPPPAPKPDFFDRHPDLEKFIGENLISKIGIAILVLAIAFFVKYAIDNDWIGPVGRVGVGLLCGGILIGIAHWLRNNYKAFSSVLVGGGIAVFYFTIALAYHQYALFGQTAAFIIMLFITAFAVLLSLLYDRQELAIIALVGGFVTPFLVSTGSGNYKVLFSYLLILNTGLLVIAYNKAWRLLNILAFGFTAILYASWLLSLPYDTIPAIYTGGFCFATVFYLLFFVINIANNIRENKKFIASDFGILLANTCLYFGGGLYLLVQMRMTQFQGLFSASMSVLNLLVTYFLFRTKKVDTNILYLLIGITLSFISLTAPIQLHGHYITLFWGSESVVLFWLFQRSRINIIRLASAAIWVAMLVSLAMDWISVYAGETLLDIRPAAPAALPIIFNKGFLTSVYCALCCFALFGLRRKASAPDGLSGSSSPLSFVAPAKIFVVAGGLLLFVCGALEIWHQFNYYYPGTNWAGIYLILYTYAFLLGFAFFSGRVKDADPQPLNAFLLGACLLLYLICIPFVFGTQHDLLEHQRSVNHFMAHWIADVLICLILYQFIDWRRKSRIKVDPGAFAWITGLFIVIFLSTEGMLLVNSIYYSNDHPLEDLQRVYIKTGLPILWGLCSFAYMWLGMRHKFKPLRILSLVLFSVTLLKLFLYDIQNIPIAGKIAAFFCLGVLLLVVSFMYQRLKKIITVLPFFMLSLCGRAQEVFTVRARISTAPSTNFYRIQVPAELVALCRPDLADLRIGRSDGEFIPYTRNNARTPGADSAIRSLISPSIERKDSSDKHSYITLFYDDTFRLEHLSLQIHDPVLYKRTVRVYDASPAGRYPHAFPLVVASIDPQHRELEIPPTRTNRLLLDIANDDNPPLALTRINTFLTPVWLLAYLQADSVYDILGGNQHADFPQYDLHYFADSLSRVITPISVGPARQQNVVILPPVPGTPTKTSTTLHPGVLLWSIIILSLLLLTFLSVKMIKALPDNDGKDRL